MERTTDDGYSSWKSIGYTDEHCNFLPLPSAVMKRRDFSFVLGSGAFYWLVPAGRAAAHRSTGLIYDPIYLKHFIAPQHPESPERLRAILRGLEQQRLWPRLQHLRPQAGQTRELLRRVHGPAHVESIQQRYPRAHSAALYAAAGVNTALDQVCRGNWSNAFCAVRPPGHHAYRSGREEGFCYYNYVAAAVFHARRQHALRRILIVDWDYHHGNGTEAFFYSDPEVLFFSTHDLHAYPGTGSAERRGAGAGLGLNINVPLPCGTSDARMIQVFRQILLPAADRFAPELILLSAGFDSRASDLLGCFSVSDAGYAELTRMLLSLADRHCQGKLVSVLEGGYNLRGLSSAVCAHVRVLLSGA